MPPTLLEQKNVLIVPLSLFIQFNTKIAREKFANLSGKFFEDMFSCDEEIEDHSRFCENLLQKILTSQIVADFNLGKKTKHEFITELLGFLNLSSNKSFDIEAAWNSLITLNQESIEALCALIKLTDEGKSIYFIGNTNELHAEKILRLFANYPYHKLSFLQNLPNPTQALPITVSQSSDSALTDLASQIGKIYFCLSYAYKNLIDPPYKNSLTQLFSSSKKASGLLTYLQAYLSNEGKTKDDILFVNVYSKSLAKKLGLDTMSKDKFYTHFKTTSASATNLQVNSAAADLHTSYRLDISANRGVY